jgi:small-conductance mechanosensitive channel
MIDDAFRIGEYIDAGRHKGTVEKISLRSVRLRHQNGQFHTIPFGQLGSVTNFSRDWATIKFNLRLARDTDIEKARKIAKELGRAMLEDPEIGKEFLLPLKMQGIADIQENAIVCRFKLTAHPAKPTYVQREAVKRLFKAFNENGIAFASSAVIVQTADGRPVDTSTITGAAAASTFPSTAIGPDGAMSPPMKSRN